MPSFIMLMSIGNSKCYVVDIEIIGKKATSLENVEIKDFEVADFLLGVAQKKFVK